MAIYFLRIKKPYSSILEMIPQHLNHFGLVKIGYTNRPVYERVNEVGRGAFGKIGYSIEMMGAINGTLSDEQHWHIKHQDLRVIGEWFALTDDLKAEIKKTVSKTPYSRLRQKVASSIRSLITNDPIICEQLHEIAEFIADGDLVYSLGEEDIYLKNYYQQALRLALQFTYNKMKEYLDEEGA